jgi:hypothetical protein
LDTAKIKDCTESKDTFKGGNDEGDILDLKIIGFELLSLPVVSNDCVLQ